MLEELVEVDWLMDSSAGGEEVRVVGDGQVALAILGASVCGHILKVVGKDAIQRMLS